MHYPKEIAPLWYYLGLSTFGIPRNYYSDNMCFERRSCDSLYLIYNVKFMLTRCMLYLIPIQQMYTLKKWWGLCSMKVPIETFQKVAIYVFGIWKPICFLNFLLIFVFSLMNAHEFPYQKYGKVWSFLLDHFIKHKPFILKEWILCLLEIFIWG